MMAIFVLRVPVMVHTCNYRTIIMAQGKVMYMYNLHETVLSNGTV